MLAEAQPLSDGEAATDADLARVQELSSWLRRARVRAEIIGTEHVLAVAEAARIEAALIVASRRVTQETLQ